MTCEIIHVKFSNVDRSVIAEEYILEIENQNKRHKKLFIRLLYEATTMFLHKNVRKCVLNICKKIAVF